LAISSDSLSICSAGANYVSQLGIGTISDRYFLDCDVASLAGIESLNEIKINIYPNPASEMLTISLPENTSNSDCILFDNVGKEVMQFVIYGGENVVDISELTSGIYVIQINSQISKLIKN
jgi:hypothetical protein